MDPYSSDFDPAAIASGLMGASALFTLLGWAVLVVPNAILCGMLAESKDRSGLVGILAGLLLFPWSTLYYLGVAPLPPQTPAHTGYKGPPAQQ